MDSGNIVIGPILKRADCYVFDIRVAGGGVRCGYPYRRIEDAHYARKATINASARGVMICQTLDELIAKAAAATPAVA